MNYKYVRKAMDKENITIYKLAQLTGLNQTTLYNGFRYGTLFPKYRRLICDALGEPEEKLFTDEERGLK